ncbi:Fc.00g044810.m01.CDS01 [Cosmosporella sp. VM-42]
MPPKAKAAATKAPSTRKAAKPAAAAAKDVKKPVKPVKKTETKPATKAAPKKRKAEEVETEPESEEEVPKAKKSRTIAKPKPVAKPVTTKTAKAKPAKKVQPEETDEEEEPKKAAPKKVSPKKASPKKAAVHKPAPTRPRAVGGRIINQHLGVKLDVYVFGEGSSGELGLGSRRVNNKKPIDVKRPRLNDNLSADKVGIVQVACGGMHAAALTHDNKILTWGVNDQGALGRDTTWDGGLRDMDTEDGSDSEDEDDTGINPKESTPIAVSDEYFPEKTQFVQIVACDSATFALTQEGRVYGWGTFRSSDGILGFTEKIRVQSTPMLMPTLKSITALAAGSNHVLALDVKGSIVAWGCGQQNQLARRIIERNKMSSLVPQGVGLPRNKFIKIACGSYHSFALDKDGHVWGWGLNNFGEIGVESNAGEDDAVILRPAKLTFLDDVKITDIDGGEHHSLACSDKGELLTWGRVDGYQVGFEFDDLSEENTIYDERKNPRILFKPTVNPDVTDVVAVAAGTDNSFAITKDGKAYSWGFSSNYQTGQGTIDDIHTPTHIDNTAIRGKNIIGAGAGGQYSVLVGEAEKPKTNGVLSNGVAHDDKENKASTEA